MLRGGEVRMLAMGQARLLVAVRKGRGTLLLQLSFLRKGRGACLLAKLRKPVIKGWWSHMVKLTL